MNVGKKGTILAILGLASLCFCSCNSAPETNLNDSTPLSESTWTRLGPGGGGVQENATINPHDPLNVFVSCNMTGAYVTYDGGEKWRMFNLGWTIRDFEFDPTSDSTVYASSNGLYGSEDLGKSWNMIYPSSERLVSVEQIGDHADQRIITDDGMPDGPVDFVRVDPVDGRHIILGISPPLRVTLNRGPDFFGDSVRILVSHDRGEHWSQCGRAEGTRVLHIAVQKQENSSDVLAIITDRAVVKINEETGRTEKLQLPTDRVLAADGVPGDGGAAYILTELEETGGQISGGLFKTSDFGRNWTQINSGLLEGWRQTGQLPEFRTLAICTGNPDLAYLSCASLYAGVNGSSERQFGIFRTVNGGAQWEWAYQANDSKILKSDFSGSWINRDYGMDWGEFPFSLAVSATQGDICYATDGGRTYYTVDGGASWRQCYSIVNQDRTYTSNGMDVTTCYGVHFDPYDSNHYIVSYTDIGLFQTHDNGMTWKHSFEGIPRKWINTCYWAEFDPDVEGRIWSVWGSCHDLPRLKMLRSGRLKAGKSAGGIAVSENGGRSWQPVTEGVPAEAVVTHLVIDPESPQDSRTLYACGFGSGVFKSTDGGRQWNACNNGLGDNMNAWRLLLKPGGEMFLLVARDLVDGKIVDGAIYYSDDGAESWRQVQMPDGANAPNDLIADPGDSRRIYLSCWPKTVEGREVSGGLFFSENNGGSWTQIFREDAHVYAAAIDPADNSTIYINTFDQAAYVSRDRGQSWSKLEGYDFKWGHRPVVDTRNPGMIFLTTFGSGLYYGNPDGVRLP